MNGSSEWTSGDHTLPLHPHNLPRPRSTCNMSNLSGTEWRREIINLDRLRSPSVGFGFTISGREGDIYVKRIFRHGLAYIDGRFQCGDKIVKIGDQQLTGTDLVLAVTLLRTSPNPVKLTVERRERNSAASPSTYTATNRFAHHRQSLPNVMYTREPSAPLIEDPVLQGSPPPSYEEAVSFDIRFCRTLSYQL